MSRPTPRIPLAPPAYDRMAVQQIIASIQQGIDELSRRGISYGVQTTVGSAGSASALPANPTGYAKVVIDGNEVVIPYYDAQ